MRPIDGNALSNSFTTQTNGPQATLEGGQYELSAASSGWNGATLALQQLLPDGATWFSRTDLALVHVNGIATGYLSPGQYRLNVSVATPSSAIAATLSRIPGE
jgi:hypothetical protein